MVLNIRHSRLTAPVGPPPTVGLAVPPPTAGVLAGVTRTTFGGSNRLTTAGQTISNVNMNFGTDPVYPLANNITLSNCQINGSATFIIDADSGPSANLTLDHCTIIGVRDSSSSTILTGNNTWTITNCVFTQVINGVIPKGGPGSLFQGNYIFELGPLGTDAGNAHVDGMQIQGPVNGMTIRGNWIESWDTSDVFISNEFGTSQNVTVDGNTLIGAPGHGTCSYSIYANGPGIRITNNRIQQGHFGGSTGGYVSNFLPDLVFTGNVDYITGLPITTPG